MRNLIPLNKQQGENTLYILGNGFDLAHKLPTSYENFHQWLIESKETSFIHAFEGLYLYVKKQEDGKWCDIESALGKIHLDDAISYDLNYQNCPDNIEGENSSHDAYFCGQNLKNVVDVFPSVLDDWARSISTKTSTPMFILSKNSRFLSFNYTRTLEDVYSIDAGSVLHIHGCVIDDKPLVVGYGTAIFEEEKESVSNDDDKVNIQLIRNLLSHCKKPVEAILKEPIPLKWFAELGNINYVIVFGHSCSSVDKPYFEKVSQCIREDAHWDFYIRDKNRNKPMSCFAEAIKGEKQTFGIINDNDHATPTTKYNPARWKI